MPARPQTASLASYTTYRHQQLLQALADAASLSVTFGEIDETRAVVDAAEQQAADLLAGLGPQS